MPNTVAVSSSTSELNYSHCSFVTMTLLICTVAECSSPGWKFAVHECAVGVVAITLRFARSVANP